MFSVKVGDGTDGAAGFFSWPRLVEILRDAREVRSDARLVRFEVDAQGVWYFREGARTRQTPEEEGAR